MKLKNVLLSSALVLTVSTLFITGNTIADTTKIIGIERFEGLTVGFTELDTVNNATVSISGPNGFVASNSAKSGIPTIYLVDFGVPSDGLYKYQITSSVVGTANTTKVGTQTAGRLNNGRQERANKVASKGISQSGYFHLENGQIKQFAALNDLTQTTSR
jgi:hypothetical protein